MQRGIPRSPETFARGLFFGFLAGAGRRLGHHPPSLSPEDSARLREGGLALPESWTLSELARAALLLSAIACLDEAEHVALLQEAFRKGDNHERVAVLRTLSLLPSPARFVPLAAEAAGTNVQDVFTALAAHNPFPACHFPELNWNQLVMKALFTGVPLTRMWGWQDRVNPELARMARDFEAERRAAGRDVPEDVARIVEAVEHASFPTEDPP